MLFRSGVGDENILVSPLRYLDQWVFVLKFGVAEIAGYYNLEQKTTMSHKMVLTLQRSFPDTPFAIRTIYRECLVKSKSWR